MDCTERIHGALWLAPVFAPILDMEPEASKHQKPNRCHAQPAPLWEQQQWSDAWLSARPATSSSNPRAKRRTARAATSSWSPGQPRLPP